MEGGSSMSPHPDIVQAVLNDFKGRRAGILKALTTNVHEFFSQCDPEKENLCLYGFGDETWVVDSPQEVVPPDLPEPVLGINFPRDTMRFQDWLSLVAAHSDAWLVSVAYYQCAQFDKTQKQRVLNEINDLPTVFEMVKVKDILNEDTGKEEKRINARSSIERAGTSTGPEVPPRRNPGVEIQATPSQLLLSSPKEKGEPTEEEDGMENICGDCGRDYEADQFWIACDKCDKWFHGDCVNISQARAERMKHFKCPLCTGKRALK